MTYDKRKLFLVSLLALATAGVSFAIRGSIGDDLQTEFFNNSAELMGGAIGIAGLGYALTIAIVRTRQGEGHAVLLVATDQGEYVLDNLSPWAMPWRQVGYQWLKRQAPGQPLTWVSIGGSS